MFKTPSPLDWFGWLSHCSTENPEMPFTHFTLTRILGMAVGGAVNLTKGAAKGEAAFNSKLLARLVRALHSQER